MTSSCGARDCGDYRRRIETFNQITNCPVVLNTSLNGPAEPIVESPGEALAFLRNSGADVLYMDGVKVSSRCHAAGV